MLLTLLLLGGVLSQNGFFLRLELVEEMIDEGLVLLLQVGVLLLRRRLNPVDDRRKLGQLLLVEDGQTALWSLQRFQNFRLEIAAGDGGEVVVVVVVDRAERGVMGGLDS